YRYFHGSLAHVQFGRDFLIRFFRSTSSEMILQFLKPLAFSRSHAFDMKLVHHALQKRERPTAIKYLFGRQVIAGFERFPVFGFQMVPGNKRVLPAALQGPRLVPFVIQKVLQRHEQERAETSFGWRDASQSAVFQKMREE